MPRQVGPTVAREELGMRLRGLRESLGFSADAAAREMYWSVVKLERVEAGAVVVAPDDVRSLLTFYGVRGKKDIATLLGLAATAPYRECMKALREVGWSGEHAIESIQQIRDSLR
jgi:transcriptional regulator with XRE-family HTH domain